MEIKNRVLKNVGIVLFISVLAKIIAFITEVILAAYMGTSEQADAYNMVIGIKQVLYPMLSIGIWKVFLPEYKKISIEKDDFEAYKFSNRILNIFLLASIVLVVFIIVFGDIIVSIIAPGFSENVKEMTVLLLRISAPQYIFIIIAAVLSAILQARGKFFASQIREVVSYIPIIFSALLFYNRFGIKTLGIGLLLGSFLRFIVLIPYMSKDFKYRFSFDFKDKLTTKLLRNMPAALITAGVSQFNTLVDRIIASNLIIGTVSSLSYGQRLINVFSSLITGSISTAIYPTMAELVAKNDIKGLKNMITKIIFIVSAIIVPISLFAFVFSSDIVSVAFERGKFDSLAVQRTAAIFKFYSLGILFVGLKDIIINVFYSFGDIKVALRITIITVVLNITLNLVFVSFMDAPGLALATSLSAAMGTTLLFIQLKDFILLNYKAISVEGIKIVFATLASITLSVFIIAFIRPEEVFVRLFIVFMIGFVSYLSILKIIGAKSLQYIISFVKEKLNKNRI